MSTIPKPPKGPESTLVCDCCGYRDKTSTYKHTCWMGIIIGCALMCIPIACFVVLGYRIFKALVV